MANEFIPCSVVACNGNAHRSRSGAKGLCKKHYARLLRHGDPLAGRTPDGDPQRFYESSLSYGGAECLLWPFVRDSQGYGRMKIGTKNLIVSRRLCEDVNGPPPTPDHHAAHSCNRGHLGCVTKGHLSWKTPAENEADKIANGTNPRGERCGTSKITEEHAREILALKGVEAQRSIAKRFGVTQGAVAHIHSGRNWGWLR